MKKREAFDVLDVVEKFSQAHPLARRARADFMSLLNVSIEVSTFDTLKNYVARGLGIAVISGLCVAEADGARLESVPIPAELGGDTTYGVIMCKGKHRSRLLADLLRLLGVGGETRP
jgi:DNA-binding transcriptional LysR family regulator